MYMYMLVYCTYSYKHVHVHIYPLFSVPWYIVHVCLSHHLSVLHVHVFTFFLFIFQTEEHQWMRVSNHLQQCPGNGCSVDMCLYIRQLCEHDMDDCDIGKWSLQDTVIVIKCLLNFSYSAILYTKRMKFCYLR